MKIIVRGISEETTKDKLKTIIEILGTSDLEINIYGQCKPIKLTDKNR